MVLEVWLKYAWWFIGKNSIFKDHGRYTVCQQRAKHNNQPGMKVRRKGLQSHWPHSESTLKLKSIKSMFFSFSCSFDFSLLTESMNIETSIPSSFSVCFSVCTCITIYIPLLHPSSTFATLLVDSRGKWNAPLYANSASLKSSGMSG